MVTEAGASVYSASAYASAELPELDVSLRGAVSIARRLQDPLAELVKIDPKSIGVGQYQHDLAESQALALARRGGRGLRERGRRRRQHRLGAAAAPGLRASATALAAQHRGAPRRATARSGRGKALQGRAAARARRRSSSARASCASATATTRSTPPACTRRPTRWCAGSSRRPGGDLRDADRQRRRCCARSSRRQFVDDTFGAADRHRHPRRAGEARPRPAPGVQDRHLRRRRARRSPTCSPAWCSRAWSPTWPRSAPSSTSACTRTVWCTSRRCRSTFVKDPRDVVKPGDVVRVKVLDVDIAAQAHLAHPAPRRRAERGGAARRGARGWRTARSRP